MSPADAYYLPTTPPTVARPQGIDGPNSRDDSGSSRHSQGSSPASVLTGVTTPSVSPNRQHGPPLLPKIRTQDVVIEPASTVGPRRHRRVLSNTRNPPGFVPYSLTRPSLPRLTVDAPDCNNLTSPISPVSIQTPETPCLSSPIVMTSATKRKGFHSRSDSASSIDDANFNPYGFPTYRQVPKYVSQPEASPISPVDGFYGQIPPVRVPQPVSVPPPSPYGAIPSPQYDYLQVQSAQLPADGFLSPDMLSPSSSTTLLNLLTEPTPPINLVRTVNYGPTRGLHDHFWWDIRQLRSWSSFSSSTFNEVKGLIQLLKTPIPRQFTPQSSVSSDKLSPESENKLIGVINNIYAPRINTALAISQGNDHMRLYVSPEASSPGRGVANGPHFLANYPSDAEVTSAGFPRGRVVGISKSFDRWNTAMRNEPPHRRVEYLKGLAHLQRCMREHSCRYGFIITEIELVCVRAGCDEGDDVPYFGYLELSAPIPTSVSAANYDPQRHGREFTPRSDGTSRSVSPSSSSSDWDLGNGLGAPMTAGLAMYFLIMLSKAVPLPSQPSGFLNVGGLGALSRQRILSEPKDKWIPEPQTGEKREAKRVRGWIWPQDAWHRREGARPKSEGRTRKSRKQ